VHAGRGENWSFAFQNRAAIQNQTEKDAHHVARFEKLTGTLFSVHLQS
jgi:hypothetical protein